MHDPVEKVGDLAAQRRARRFRARRTLAHPGLPSGEDLFTPLFDEFGQRHPRPSPPMGARFEPRTVTPFGTQDKQATIATQPSQRRVSRWMVLPRGVATKTTSPSAARTSPCPMVGSASSEPSSVNEGESLPSRVMSAA